MTDELVKRLRANTSWGDDRFAEAADRIEALTAERDRLKLDVVQFRRANDGLQDMLSQSKEVGFAFDNLTEITAERDRLREALEQIEIACEEEIRARTAGMSEAALGKSRILPLLQVPRNIARAALKGETP